MSLKHISEIMADVLAMYGIEPDDYEPDVESQPDVEADDTE